MLVFFAVRADAPIMAHLWEWLVLDENDKFG